MTMLVYVAMAMACSGDNEGINNDACIPAMAHLLDCFEMKASMATLLAYAAMACAAAYEGIDDDVA